MLEKRVILTKKDKLKILIDSESLSTLLSENNKATRKLLKYSDAELFCFIRSPFDTKHPELKKIVEFREGRDKKDELTTIDIAWGKSSSRTFFRYKIHDVEDFATHVYNKRSLTNSETRSVILIFIQATLSGVGHSDLFITNNDTIIKNRLWFESRFPGLLNIMTVGEALQFMDLFAKYRDTYFVSSHHVCNRGLWYLYSFKTKVPNYQLPWSSVVFGIPIPNGMEILQGFSDRFLDLLRAIDEIGFEFYKGANNDTMNGMVYHLNYFISLVTGLFDNLAILSLFLHNIDVKDVDVHQKKNMHKISLRNKDFLNALEKENQNLHDFVIKNKNFIELFYPFRDEIIHRSGLKRAGFEYKDKDVFWKMNVINLPKDIVGMIEKFDEKSDYEYVTKWGMYNAGSKYCYLEPFHFVKAATIKLVEFCNKYFELLAFKNLLEKHPEVNRKIKESIKSNSHKNFNKSIELFQIDHLGF